MKIYRIREDVGSFQSISPKDEALWASDQLTFDCHAKGENWVAPACYVLNPKLQKGSFFYLCPGVLVFNHDARAALEDIMEMAGEMLPLDVDGETLYVLNVRDCVNALDAEQSAWQVSPSSGARLGIERYVFHAGRLSESSLFKIPETSRSEVLTYAEVKDPDDELKARYERAGLIGLVFEQLWSDSP